MPKWKKKGIGLYKINLPDLTKIENVGKSSWSWFKLVELKKINQKASCFKI